MKPIHSLTFCAGLLALAACQSQTDTLSLAGEWRFAIDSLDRGQTEGWATRQLEATLRLPGSMQEQGFGDDVSVRTPWTGQIVDQSWYTAPEYAKYREKGNVKVPFWLNPDKHYVGAAWYQRTVDIPEGWQGRPVELELERTHWTTDLYLDGRKVDSRESLQTPHRYVFEDGLAPGTHTLTLRVDNSLYVDVGYNAHSVSDHTQSNWNGLIGELKLTAKPAVYVDYVRTDPDTENKDVRLRVSLKGTVPEGGATLALKATTFDGTEVGQDLTIDLEGGASDLVVDTLLELGEKAQLWSEYTPTPYTLHAEIEADGHRDTYTTDFGLRTFKARGTRFEINGRPVFLRGTLECCIFPQTGYPSMDPAYWVKIYNTCREYGLNHVRFHSWCPPEVAFHVADSLGFFLAVECGTWTTVGDGQPQDEWIRRESERILQEYGNHPSFCLMAHGNEPSGSKQVEYLNELVARWKSEDDRRVYTSSPGWPFVESSDYWNPMDPRIQVWGAGLRSVINAQPPRTDYDFAHIIRKDRPTVSHEVGQWCVYPDFKEIKKYTGVLKAKNFEIFQETLSEKGMAQMADKFLYASGRLQTLCYKADIEAALRTPGFAGFQLLDLHDFPGQGTALVGVLNPFWESKGYVDGEEYRTFCNSTVPLVRFPKMNWLNNERLKAPVEVAHFGAEPMKNAEIKWTLKTAGGTLIGEGSKRVDLPLTNCIAAGEIDCDLAAIQKATRLVATVEVAGTDYQNSWNVYVYPAQKAAVADMPLVTTTLDARAKAELERGGKVLLLPYGKVPADRGGDIPVGFSSIFWNTAWSRKQAPHTLGVYCDPKHPALAQFPNEGYSDWQWWDVVSRCNAMVLDSLPKDFTPVVYLIDDWFTNRKLGLVYEARVGRGRLLVCSSDLATDLDKRPAAAQLRQSLLEYMASDRFQPSQPLTLEQLDDALGARQ